MKIAITRADGGVSIMNLANPQYPLQHASALEKWKMQHAEQYVSHRPIADDDVPEDDEFRDAWKDSDGRIVVDMDKARAIHAGRLATNAMLEAQAKIAANITQDAAVMAAKTPEELKLATPSTLETLEART